MSTGKPAELQLTEEEAFALLAMCLTSPHNLDAVSEHALRKLAEYALSTSNNNEGQMIDLATYAASRA